MKNITKIFAIALVALGFSTSSFAQADATASATATLVTPLSISVVTNMNFGTVASSATAGTVVITSGDVVTATDGATLIAGGAARKAAEFEVTGAVSSSFSVSCPTSIILSSGGNNLTVNAIAPDCGANATLSADLGKKTIKVGGTLVLPAGSLAGIYTNTTDLKVTVDYN